MKLYDNQYKIVTYSALMLTKWGMLKEELMSGVYECEIIKNEKLTDSICSILISAPQIAQKAAAGQFINIKCGEERLLRRPISISRVINDELLIVFEVKGEGTKWLSQRKPNESLDILGPLGKGFSVPEGKVILVGGGIGAPPLLFAADASNAAFTAILGFRDAGKIILKSEFEASCENVYITTDDGSIGIHGTVTKPLEELLSREKYAAVISCGPKPMLKAVAELSARFAVSCQVSLEERMGCGVGACVVCACATIVKGKDAMSRVCKDGPVFDAAEVVW